jgi:hypothetical protein
MLAGIYINYQKRTDALSSLRRAKQILEERDGHDTEAYAVILLKIAQLMLSANMLKDAHQQGVKAYGKIVDGEDLTKIVQTV